MYKFIYDVSVINTRLLHLDVLWGTIILLWQYLILRKPGRLKGRCDPLPPELHIHCFFSFKQLSIGSGGGLSCLWWTGMAIRGVGRPSIIKKQIYCVPIFC